MEVVMVPVTTIRAIVPQHPLVGLEVRVVEVLVLIMVIELLGAQET
jgi:hypothetical protein